MAELTELDVGDEIVITAAQWEKLKALAGPQDETDQARLVRCTSELAELLKVGRFDASMMRFLEFFLRAALKGVEKTMHDKFGMLLQAELTTKDRDIVNAQLKRAMNLPGPHNSKGNGG